MDKRKEQASLQGGMIQTKRMGRKTQEPSKEHKISAAERGGTVRPRLYDDGHMDIYVTQHNQSVGELMNAAFVVCLATRSYKEAKKNIDGAAGETLGAQSERHEG